MTNGTSGPQKGFTQGGFEDRFRVTRVDGKPISDKARYLILDYSGRDPHAKLALQVYAASCWRDNPKLSMDIRDALDCPADWPAQHD